MEPCLFRHGKHLRQFHLRQFHLRLQWSHVFSDMVRCPRDTARARSSRLQWSHVFSDMVRREGEGRGVLGGDASMEPCLFRHGKGWRKGSFSRSQPTLQWSHVFSDMVRFDDGDELPREAAASMEPCLFRHGKQVNTLFWIEPYTCFNGAMSFQTW